MRILIISGLMALAGFCALSFILGLSAGYDRHARYGRTFEVVGVNGHRTPDKTNEQVTYIIIMPADGGSMPYGIESWVPKTDFAPNTELKTGDKIMLFRGTTTDKGVFRKLEDPCPVNADK